jgi:vacuolar protein sorting-associated protein 45
MDIVKAVETYITRMVSEPNAMKVLLLDTHTVRPLYDILFT